MIIDYVDPKDLIDKNVFELLGLKNAPEEKKQEITDNMLRTVQNRVLARILDGLNDEELRRYEQIIDTGDDQKALEFLDSKNIDLTELAAEEALNYKLELINMIKDQMPASAA